MLFTVFTLIPLYPVFLSYSNGESLWSHLSVSLRILCIFGHWSWKSLWWNKSTFSTSCWREGALLSSQPQLVAVRRSKVILLGRRWKDRVSACFWCHASECGLLPNVVNRRLHQCSRCLKRWVQLCPEWNRVLYVWCIVPCTKLRYLFKTTVCWMSRWPVLICSVVYGVITAMFKAWNVTWTEAGIALWLWCYEMVSTVLVGMCKIKTGVWIIQESSWHAAFVVSRCRRLRGKQHKKQNCDWCSLGALTVIKSSRYPSSGWRTLSAAPQCCVKLSRARSLASIWWWKCLPVLNLCLQMWHSDKGLGTGSPAGPTAGTSSGPARVTPLARFF